MKHNGKYETKILETKNIIATNLTRHMMIGSRHPQTS